MTTTNPSQPARKPGGLLAFLSRTHGKRRFDITDALSYLYLVIGVFVMFGPVLWLVMSSFKPASTLTKRPISFLPYQQDTVTLDEFDRPMPLYDVEVDGEKRTLAALLKTGPGERIVSRYTIELIDPASPDTAEEVLITEVAPLYDVRIDGEIQRLVAELKNNGEPKIVERTFSMVIDPENPNEPALEVRKNEMRPVDETIEIEGYDAPLALYDITLDDGTDLRVAALPGERTPTRDVSKSYISMYDAADPENTQIEIFLDGETITPVTIEAAGYDAPLPLYVQFLEDGSLAERAAALDETGSVLITQRSYNLMIDPNTPDMDPIEVPRGTLKEVRSIKFDFGNYEGAINSFDFLVYLRNSVVVTVVATAITLLINSMAAFGLSKYKFKGRDAIFLIIVSTLMVPVSVILIPAFLVITKVGWANNLWGLIIPGAATPTGVFLLRQYMLTIPDELLDSARIDGASEWRIYWQVVLPLARPALAVLAIFSVMWRWNDFLWPLIVVTRNDLYTLPVALNNFQGNLNIQWNYILAMTVLTLLPVTLVFAFLQRYITTGIATTGMK